MQPPQVEPLYEYPVSLLNRDIENLLVQLQQDKSLKVWSLIITFFGDVVLSRGGNVSAKTVQHLLGAMGVGSGAVRTALSRLASDHWITRQKLGRESYYELASDGCELSYQAAARIYAPVLAINSGAANSRGVNKRGADKVSKSAAKGAKMGGSEAGQWQIVIAGPGSGFPESADHAIQVSANCRLYLASDISSASHKECLVVSGDLQQVPSWMTENLMPRSVRLGYQALVDQFSAIKQPDKLSNLDCLVLRCLLVHEWRRLLLKTPVVPCELQTCQWPENEWPENDCRQFVAELYQKLVVRSESWLNEHATCINGSLPEPIDSVTSRFTADFAVFTDQ